MRRGKKTRQKVKEKYMYLKKIIGAASVAESAAHPPAGYRGNPDKDVSSLILLTGLCIGSDKPEYQLHWPGTSSSGATDRNKGGRRQTA